MNGLFAFLFLISLSVLIVGIIKPSIFTRLLKREVGRKQIALILGGLSIFFFVLTGITAEKQIPKEDGSQVAVEQKVAPAEVTEKSLCSTSVKEMPAPSGSRYPDRKYYEEIHCGDGNTKVFKLSRQLTDVGVYKNGELQAMCSGSDICDATYNPYDPNNVIITFTKAPEKDSVIKINGAVALPSEMKPPQPPTLGKVIFDIRVLAPKISYTNIKSALGKPTQEGLPDPLIGMDGWAEWDKEGWTLSINYDRTGILKNQGGLLGCAISLSPKKGWVSEDQLRLAGNLPKGNSFIIEDKQLGILLTFVIKPAYTIEKNSKLYAIEVCL